MSPRGTVVVHRLDSKVLKGNSLGDPTERDLHVYLPPNHDPKKPLPALLAIVGFTGTGASLFNVDPLGEDLRARLDRLIDTGKMAPCIVAAPDCFTRVGGNQYINSTATGRYEDYLVDEILPFVAEKYAVKRWGVFGKSSGGYGSIVLGMHRPDVFHALADHSGDAGFELCYIGEFAGALDELKKAGGPSAWLDRFWADENRHRRQHHKTLNTVGMAAHYSPNPKSPHLGIDFPFDLETGEFKQDVWERWRAWDPVNMADKFGENLKKLRYVYIDCGTRDEFNLVWGARALKRKLEERGVSVDYQEFEDGHMSVSYRYDVSLPRLVKALDE